MKLQMLLDIVELSTKYSMSIQSKVYSDALTGLQDILQAHLDLGIATSIEKKVLQCIKQLIKQHAQEVGN